MLRRMIAVAMVWFLFGCKSELETGYKPRPIGSASSVERRSYYASPFTPEARAAQQEREQELDARRPRPGY